jgi:hypothetical protein
VNGFHFTCRDAFFCHVVDGTAEQADILRQDIEHPAVGGGLQTEPCHILLQASERFLHNGADLFQFVVGHAVFPFGLRGTGAASACSINIRPASERELIPFFSIH